MEIITYIIGALVIVTGLLSTVFLSIGHRDLGLWTACAAIVLVVIGGFCWYQDKLWSQDTQNEKTILVTGNEQPSGSKSNSAKLNVGGDLNVDGDIVVGNKINVYTEKSEEKKLIVTPDEFSMVAGQNSKFIMKVTNNKDIPVYAVNVTFRIEGGDFLVDDLHIESIDQPALTGELGDDQGKIIVSFDGMQIQGVSGRNGDKADYMEMITDNISARSTKDYRVNIKGMQRLKNSTLKIDVGNFSTKPNPIIEGIIPTAPEDSLYQKGNSLIAQHKYQDAIKSFKDAYQINPRSAKVINNWGLALNYSGMIEAAIEKYKEAINVDQSFSPAYFNLGALYLQNKDYEKAVEQFEKAISTDPNYLGSYFLCAKAYENIKQYNEAIRIYTKFIELESNTAQKQEAEKAIQNIKINYLHN